jgi:hypothetical protein
VSAARLVDLRLSITLVMKQNCKLALLASLAVLFNSAEVNAAPLLPKYKRVGVTSLIGTEMQAKFVGFMAFANKGWTGDTGKLTISDFVRDETVRALRERGYQAQPLKIDSKSWYDRIRGTHKFTLRGLAAAYGADMTTSEFKKELADLAKTNHLDAIIMFVPGRDTLSHTEESWVGVGDTGFGFKAHSREQIDQPYVFGFLYLNDASTLKTVRRVRVEAFGDPVNVPFPPDYRSLNETQRRALEKSMTEGYRMAIRRSLGEL